MGRHLEDGLAFEESTLHALMHIFPHHVDPVAVSHVGLGDDHHTVLDAQQLQNVQMLNGLGHKTFVCRHDQHGEVDTARACQHILDKLFMSRHVHDTRLGAVGEIQMGKTKLNGNASLLFFFQAVGIDAGQRTDQRSLTVVNVTCRTNDDVFHPFIASLTASAT